MSNPDITISKLDESYIIVECAEESTQADLHTYFTFKAPNYKFHPLYKARKWDGSIRLYSKITHKLPAGLLRYILAFSEERNFKVQVEDNLGVLNNFSLNDAENYIKTLDIHSNQKPLKPYEHQIVGLAKAIRYKRILLQSPTSSGKSLVLYSIVRYLLDNECKKGLIIVPTVNLVAQLYTDFQDYATGPDYATWSVETNCHRLYQGHEKDTDAKITLSTWQSIYDMPKEWFEQFDFVINDECHLSVANSLKKIMNNLVNAKYRIGTTGTLDDWKVHRLVIEGHFGPMSKLTTTKELQDKGIIAKSKINGLILKYSESESKNLRRTSGAFKKSVERWKNEIDFLCQHSKRNQFISKLASSLKGNVLVLFNFKDHGDILYDLLNGLEKKVHLVTGDTLVETREEVRHLAEASDDIIILASYGVFSQGVSIKNLHHVIFASPSKSKIRVLQSIGRGLRLKEGKEFVTIYDITDDLRVGRWTNITLKHYTHRLRYYKEENWIVSSYVIDLN